MLVGWTFDNFRRLPRLRTFLIDYQNEPRIEVRRQNTDWSLEVFDLADPIDRPDVDGTVPVADVYARVAF